MGKKQILDFIRSRYPDIPFLKRTLAGFRIKRTARILLSEKKITAAENNFEQKIKSVEYCRKKWGKDFNQTYINAQRLFNNVTIHRNSENKEKLLIDILFCRFAYGFQPEEYLCFDLELKNMRERQSFVSDIQRYCYVYRMNDISKIQIFNNKGQTYKVFKKYYKRDAVYIAKESDFKIFNTFVQKHPIFVRKAVYEGMGRSVSLVDLTSEKISVKKLFKDIVSHGPHILEEKVEQHKILADLNISSVNTIRCITLYTKHGVQVPYCFMKVGRAGSFVDNGGAGGILVGIDKDTGILNTAGYDEYSTKYNIHPDSGIQFKGYQLPEWKAMLEICKEMSAKMPAIKFIGWDMAYTDNGWVVIEGNGMSQLIGPQIVWRYGVRNEMEEYMKDMDLII